MVEAASVVATRVVAADGPGGLPEEALGVGDFEGIDFELVGKEQKAAFIDSQGKTHAVFVYFPPEAADNAARPTCVYMHSMAWDSPLMASCKPDSYGMQIARSNFIFISPIVPGIKDKDAYLDTDTGEVALTWLEELVRRLAHGGLPGPDGALRVDQGCIAVTGVSLGGAFAYQLAARCTGMLSGVVPVAAYHAPRAAEVLAEGLAKMSVLCVHSVSPTEKTCPIGEERPLWARIEQLGGQLQVKEVHCKHGKTFSHAYEVDGDVWAWLMKQRR